MAVTVIEYGGYTSGRVFSAGVPVGPPIQVTQFSSAATSTGFFNLATRFVQLISIGVNAYFLPTYSTSSTITLSTATSTNGIPLPAGVYYDWYAVPNPAALNGTSTATSTSGFRYSILSS